MESAWLIEHPNVNAPPRYVSLVDGELRWTAAASKALRLSRFEDAEAFNNVFLAGVGRPSEHGWY